MSELPSYSAEHIAANYPNRTDASLLSGPYTPTCIAVREIDRLTSCISETVTRAEQAEADLHFYKGVAGGMVRREDGSVTEFGKTLQELRDVRAYAVAQTQLLYRAIKMMQMAGYGVAPHDADHNNPVIAWMAEARELLAKNPNGALAQSGIERSPVTAEVAGSNPARIATSEFETCTEDELGSCMHGVPSDIECAICDAPDKPTPMMVEAAKLHKQLRHQSCTKSSDVREAAQRVLDVYFGPATTPRAAVQGPLLFSAMESLKAAMAEDVRHQVCNVPAPDFDSWFKARPVQTPLSYTAVERALREAWDAALQSVAGKKSPARVNCGKCDHPMGCESECRIKAASDSQSAIGRES